jgi:tetratricopeptide (TPR) repeat protein
MTLTSKSMERACKAGKTLLIVLAVGVGAAGCTSLSSYDTAARTPAPADAITPPGFPPATNAGRSENAGLAAPRGEASLPVAAEPRANQPKPRQENAASAVLLEQSRGERAAGSYADAAVSIERALRIDPNNPALWIELAEVKADEGDFDQAEMMARKALTLAGSDRSIMARAERLLGR